MKIEKSSMEETLYPTPEPYVRKMLIEDSYEDLIGQRFEWRGYVEDYENDALEDGEWDMEPGPEYIYQWCLKCLSLLCKGMAERFGQGTKQDVLRSAEVFVEKMLAEANYAELVAQRTEWLESVDDFEDEKIPDEEWDMDPGPDVQYQWRLECLSLIFKGMAEKYNREYIRTGRRFDLAAEMWPD